MGVLLLTLVAVMALFVAEPDRAHAQTLSADATLATLEVEGGPSEAELTLTPTFSGGQNDTERMFTGRIPFTDTGVVITPTASEAGEIDAAMNSIIRVNGTVVASGATHNVSLAGRAGRTSTITIVVTAPQRTVTETYTVKVYRERQTLSDNANLASLSVSGGSLTPRFSSGHRSYTARVQADTATISYRLSDTGGGASVGDITASGGVSVDQAKKEVPLGDEASTTTITVPVTAEDDSAESYIIAVYHVRANRDTNANLATLELTAVGGTRVGDALDDEDIADGMTTDYKERMNNATTHVTVAAAAADTGGATVAISPSDARPGAGDDTGHQVALRAGAETTITVTVTAEDTDRRQTYTIKVYRERATPSDDNNLNTLRLSAGTLTPTFNRDTTGYTAQVAADVSKVTVSYAASDTAGGSSVVVTSDQDGTITNDEVDLAAAGSPTTITVTVTPESGETAAPSATPPTPGNKVYTITVYRLRALPSADASLSGITVTPVDAGTLDPEFVPTTKMYNVNVEHNISAITVDAAATTANMGATVAITPGGGNNVPLRAGAQTPFRITVTAEDRTTTDTYMVTVYRQRADISDDATLSALSLSAGTLSPAFMSDTIEYKSRVANDVDKVTVSSTLGDNAGGASVAVAPSTDTDCSDDATHVSGDVSLSAGANTHICVTATAEDDDISKTYMITVYRLRANANTDASLNAFTIAEATGTINITDGMILDLRPAILPTLDLDDSSNKDPDVVYRVRQVTVDATADIGAIVTIMPADADTGEPGHQVDFTAGAETMITVEVTPEDSAAPSKTYTANVYRKNVPGSESDDATLSSLMLSDAALTPAFASGTMEYTAEAAHGIEKTTVTGIATHIGAQSSVTVGTLSGMTFTLGDDDVPLTAGQEVTRTVEVTAEDGTTKEYYTVTISVAADVGGTLLERYDADDSGVIELAEVSTAIEHYFNDQLTLAEVIAVINLYFS